MAPRHTRRSVSVKGTTYQRVKNHVKERGGSISGFLEDLIREKLGEPTDEERRKFGEAMKVRQKKAQEARATSKPGDEADEFHATYTPPIKLF